MRNSQFLIIGLFFFTISTSADAQMDHGPAINVSVKPGATIRITRQFMVGPFCGFDGPSITSFQTPKFGTISTEKRRERIPPNTVLTGDGHAYCDQETGVTVLTYKAGNVVGTDIFDIVIQFGRASRTQKVTVKVLGK